MNRNISLIITSKEDSHADLVIAKILKKSLDIEIVRLNTEDFCSNVEIEFNGDNFLVFIRDSHKKFRSSEVLSVWFRRPKEIEVSHTNDEIAAFIKAQSTALLRGLYFGTHDSSRWVNPLPNMHRARNKFQQIQLARKLDMRIPETLTTNNPSRAIEFVERLGKVCTKSLDEPNFLLDGHIFPMFTRLLSKQEVIENADGIKNCPTLFQEYIDKKYDLRVTVVGKDIYPVAIYSQDNDLSRVDFRGLAPGKMKREFVDIPVHLKTQILKFTYFQGLEYSAMDFVVTPDEQYVFLENNPNGQWQWIDDVTEGQISDAMIGLLLNLG
ncbi:MAG: hypothetical protein PUP90_02890 [Nostoc sp. S4]|nr:hypothetical protein [Nostoc sp. S4]